MLYSTIISIFFDMRFLYNISLLVILLLVSCSSKDFDSVSEQTKGVVKQIEEINVVMSSAVGIAGLRPKHPPCQYK